MSEASIALRKGYVCAVARRTLAVLGSSALLAGGVPAAQDPAGAAPDLRAAPPPGERVARDLGGREAHRYALRLDRGAYLHAVVVQDGIDAVVTVSAPGGARVAEVDSPNGTSGPEPVHLVAAASGEYAIEVRALEADAPRGRYELHVEAIRPATAKDRRRIEGARLHAEAFRLRDAFEYGEARRLGERALALREASLGRDHLDVAATLEVLGLIYDEIGEFRRGADAFARALAIYERQTPDDDRAVSRASSDLGFLQTAAGDFAGAEASLTRALALRERRMPEMRTGLLGTLMGLGGLYVSAGRYDDAERALRRCIDETERAFGAKHQRLRPPLTHLARVHVARGELDAAATVAARALAIAEKAPPPPPRSFGALGLASTLCRNAEVAAAKGDDAAAERYLLRAIGLCERASGRSGVAVSEPLRLLGSLYVRRGESVRAVPLLTRAVAIRERSHGPGHTATADALLALAEARAARRDFARAESLLRRALAIREAAFGREHFAVGGPLAALAALYEATRRESLARPLRERARSLAPPATGSGASVSAAP